MWLPKSICLKHELEPSPHGDYAVKEGPPVFLDNDQLTGASVLSWREDPGLAGALQLATVVLCPLCPW